MQKAVYSLPTLESVNANIAVAPVELRSIEFTCLSPQHGTS